MTPIKKHTADLAPKQPLLSALYQRTHRRSIRGIASLPAILLFGSIIIEIGIAGAFLVYYLNTSLYGTRIANQALVAAQAGIDDGVLKIIQDRTCPNATCSSDYQLSFETAGAHVIICKDTCAGAGKTQITSIGQALTKQRQLIAILSVDSITGLVSVDSVLETPL